MISIKFAKNNGFEKKKFKRQIKVVDFSELHVIWNDMLFLETFMANAFGPFFCKFCQDSTSYVFFSCTVFKFSCGCLWSAIQSTLLTLCSSCVVRNLREQGRIHDCPCRGRLGRGRNNLGRGINNHRILIPELFYLQIAQKRRKSKVGRTDGPTDRPTDRPTR